MLRVLTLFVMILLSEVNEYMIVVLVRRSANFNNAFNKLNDMDIEKDVIKYSHLLLRIVTVEEVRC